MVLVVPRLQTCWVARHVHRVADHLGFDDSEVWRMRTEHWTPAEVAGMRAALTAAREGVRGANPLVGAAIIVSGEPVAVGRHLGAGTPHAEVDALGRALDAGVDLHRATLLVTLEPCNHHGRTGPCTQAILAAGIPEVICAVPDPNPAAGGGARRLAEAGVRVRVGLGAAEATRLNQRWLAGVQQHRPFVTAKIAQSLDGRIAAADTTSRWITGPRARGFAHDLRARVDAVVVGTQTLIVDDPQLTARDAQGRALPDQPLRVVMGLRPVPARAAIRRCDDNWCRIPTRDPAEGLAQLHRRGVGHVLIEGGATLTSAFLAADLVDELVVQVAPILLGEGRPAVSHLGVDSLVDARRFELDRPPIVHDSDVTLSLVPVPK